MVVIIAIVSAVALLSLGLLGGDRELETEARRLAALVEVAQDEAMMQGREFGLEFMTDSYRFVEYDPLSSQWMELFGDDMFRMRQLPEDVEFDLYLEGKRILLDFEPAEMEEPEEDAPMRMVEDTYAPHILIYSSGDVTPFELEITRRLADQSVRLEADLTGEIDLADDEDG